MKALSRARAKVFLTRAENLLNTMELAERERNPDGVATNAVQAAIARESSAEARTVRLGPQLGGPDFRGRSVGATLVAPNRWSHVVRPTRRWTTASLTLLCPERARLSPLLVHASVPGTRAEKVKLH